MSDIKHSGLPSNLSILGIKQETVQGTEMTGEYRGLLVENFNVSPIDTDRSRVNVVGGYKGAYTGKDGAISVPVSFRCFAGPSNANQATLLDIMYMMLDFDTVTGSSPYTHTMDQENAVIAKKSWSLYHDDGNGVYEAITGFVANSISIVIDKTQGYIGMDVEGFAWRSVSTTVKTVNFSANYQFYSPATAKLEYGATPDTINSFNVITINLSCGTRVFHGISDNRYPTNINGQSLDLSVSMEGEWNIADSSISQTLKNAFLNATVMTNQIIISFGSSATNAYFVLTIPRWYLESEDSKNVEGEAMLPQSVTLYPVWTADMASNGWKIEILDLIDSNAGSL